MGVFLDTGLPEASGCFLSTSSPEIKELWPKKGDQLYVKLDVDKKDRIWPYQLFRKKFQKMAGPGLMTICKTKLCERFSLPFENEWYFCLFARQQHAWFYPSRANALRNRVWVRFWRARVIGYRAVRSDLELVFKPRSFEMLENDAQMILTYLESNGGFMTLNDKSAPEDIKATFGISKGQFKKALGGLLKAKKIKQDELEQN